MGYQDGSGANDAAQDPVVGLRIGGSDGHVSGKLVDLDPQCQLSSEIWGLTIRLHDGKTSAFFEGDFAPVPFRDILFGRQSGPAVNGQTASSVFQSVLTNVQWPTALDASRCLRELRANTADGLLSVALTTFGYFTVSTQDRFTFGTVIGAIGPAHASEPLSFVRGRRMAPANSRSTAAGLNFFSCTVDETASTVTADLGNSLPLTNSPSGRELRDIGRLDLAVLNHTAGRNDNLLTEGRPISASQYLRLGAIDYRQPDWLLNTAGLITFPIDDAALDLLRDHPLALIQTDAGGRQTIAIRETPGGLFVRAEPFVHRLDPGRQTPVVAETTFYAAAYGRPLPDAAINVNLSPPSQPAGAGGAQPPSAPVPYMGFPQDAITYAQTLDTQDDGTAVLTVQASDPDNPRGYIDGQIYVLNYSLETATPIPQPGLDVIVLHVRDAFEVPEQPTWVAHIQPILQQFGNLYPIMSQQLFDLGNYDEVVRHRAILELAFSLDMANPNHMPVTRDLSGARTETILKWLRQKNPDGTYALIYGNPDNKLIPARPRSPDAAALRALAPAVRVAPSPRAHGTAEELQEEIGGKADFMRSLIQAQDQTAQ